MTAQLSHPSIKGSLVTWESSETDCKMGGSKRLVPCGRVKVINIPPNFNRIVADRHSHDIEGQGDHLSGEIQVPGRPGF